LGPGNILAGPNRECQVAGRAAVVQAAWRGHAARARLREQCGATAWRASRLGAVRHWLASLGPPAAETVLAFTDRRGAATRLLLRARRCVPAAVVCGAAFGVEGEPIRGVRTDVVLRVRGRGRQPGEFYIHSKVLATTPATTPEQDDHTLLTCSWSNALAPQPFQQDIPISGCSACYSS
jgi:hypothetical protein